MGDYTNKQLSDEDVKEVTGGYTLIQIKDELVNHYMSIPGVGEVVTLFYKQDYGHAMAKLSGLAKEYPELAYLLN